MIRNIKLENFKFHKELKFNISKTNCLIYGENGSGKSSIYWGLYSIFKKNSMEKDIEEYKTHGSNSSPNVEITLDDSTILNNNINETKLKLTSMAIFFGLIKIEEDETNSLKLLVLDDFLTSLDMANRKLIIQYILDNFSDYQIIIFTHNIQFFNLIIGRAFKNER